MTRGFFCTAASDSHLKTNKHINPSNISQSYPLENKDIQFSSSFESLNNFATYTLSLKFKSTTKKAAKKISKLLLSHFLVLLLIPEKTELPKYKQETKSLLTTSI